MNELKEYTTDELRTYIADLNQTITETEAEISDVVEELKSRKITYRIGQRFMIDNEEHILAQTGFGKVQFINLVNGNRKNGGMALDNIHNITRQEINMMAEDWYLIE